MNASNKTSIILDSGAFSAWMKQSEISVDDYADFALKNMDKIDYVVNLDVIPGSFGVKNISNEDLEFSANKGWDNYNRLIERGIDRNKIIHVFHQGEKFYHLEKMVDELDYIGISPANDRNTKEKINWLDDCMKYIADDAGKAKVKFHGFAVTSLPIICKFPWYSVDSTSWVTFGKFGAILYPRTTRGRLDYTKPPIVIFISNRSEQQNKIGKHFETLSRIEQEKVVSYVKDQGFSIQTLSENNLERDRLNMLFYIDVEKHLKGVNKVKIYYAGNFLMLSKMSREFKTRKIALTKALNYNRLCSFYYKKYAINTLQLKEENYGKKRTFKRTNRHKARSSK